MASVVDAYRLYNGVAATPLTRRTTNRAFLRGQTWTETAAHCHAALCDDYSIQCNMRASNTTMTTAKLVAPLVRKHARCALLGTAVNLPMLAAPERT
jgi:xanthine dehydrogenase iron-sulfur cluster and FAD-binding subunit A